MLEKDVFSLIWRKQTNKQKQLKKKINIGYNEWQFMNIQSDSKE